MSIVQKVKSGSYVEQRLAKIGDHKSLSVLCKVQVNYN